MIEENKYLPMGSIVILKKGNREIMIYGRRQMMATTGELFDYVACLYPEGNLNPNQSYLFNHDDIKEILYLGCQDEKEKSFNAFLNNIND